MSTVVDAFGYNQRINIFLWCLRNGVRSIDLPKTFENSHGMRFWQADVLNVLGSRYSVSVWTEATTLFRRSGQEIEKLCREALKQNRQEVSNSLLEVAEVEEQAYRLLKAS